MLTLKEILDNLVYGELSHVSIGNAALGFINPKDYPKIVSCLNGALTAIHKRFLLRTGELRIQQQVDLKTYYLRPTYAQSNENDPLITKYILDDSADPFTGNIFKIEKVFRADATEVVINDSSQEFPVFTPNFDTLIMTPTDPPEIIRVTYRADHPRIKVDVDFDPNLIQLHIPTAILDAISLNVASRIYTPLTSGDGQTSAASTYMYQYELECKRLEAEGIALEGDSCDTRFETNGWL